MLLQGKDPEDQIGYHSGFNTLVTERVLDGYFALPYRNCSTTNDWHRLYANAEKIVKEQDIDTLLLQFFHGPQIPSPELFIQNVRRSNPDLFVIATSGDGFGRFFNRLPRSILTAARLADITFFTGMGYMAQMAVNAEWWTPVHYRVKNLARMGDHSSFSRTTRIYIHTVVPNG